MAPDDLTLAVRPAGSDAWVVIDPSTKRGRRLAAAFGFTPTHPTEETIAMSAIPAETTVRPHLTVVQSNTEKMGLLLAFRTKARRAFDYMLTLPKSAWAWAKRTFHLEAAADFVGSGYSWLKAKASAAAGYLGASGGVGLGMLAVSTGIGRTLIGYALKPVFWGLSIFGKAWTWAEETLATGRPIEDETGVGKVRNWISERMADFRERFTGNGTSEGLFAKALGFVGKHVYPVFQIDSTWMQAARTGGSALVGWKLVALVPLLPFGGPTLLAAAQWVIGGLVAMTVAIQARPLYAKGKDKVTGIFAEVDEDAAAVAHEAAQKVTQMPGTADTPQNRAARRAANRRSTPVKA